MFTQSWKYLNVKDPALAELEKRISEAGRKGETLTYTQIVQGIDFHSPIIDGGAAHRIDSFAHPRDRVLIGEYLTYISRESHLQEDFLASALVVTEAEGISSEPFFDLAVNLSLLSPNQNRVSFWSREVKKAYAYYQNLPSMNAATPSPTSPSPVSGTASSSQATASAPTSNASAVSGASGATTPSGSSASTPVAAPPVLQLRTLQLRTL